MQTWLWPDRVIGKRESRKLREEHNTLVNDRDRLLAACVRIRRAVHWSTTDDRMEEKEMIALLDAAIAGRG